MTGSKTVAPEGRRRQKRGWTLADEVYGQVRGEILGGVLLPGVKLSPIVLAERFEVSATVVREALTRLVADGLVRSQSQHGFTVATTTEQDLKDLTALRVLVDCEGLRLSMASGGLAWQSRVLAAHHMLAHTPDRMDGPGRERYLSAHAEFHATLVSACGNERLIAQSVSLYNASQLYRTLSRPLNPKRRRIADEHRDILEAALAGDVDRAVNALRDHYERTLRILLDAGVFAHELNV